MRDVRVIKLPLCLTPLCSPQTHAHNTRLHLHLFTCWKTGLAGSLSIKRKIAQKKKTLDGNSDQTRGGWMFWSLVARLQKIVNLNYWKECPDSCKTWSLKTMRFTHQPSQHCYSVWLMRMSDTGSVLPGSHITFRLKPQPFFCFHRTVENLCGLVTVD